MPGVQDVPHGFKLRPGVHDFPRGGKARFEGFRGPLSSQPPALCNLRIVVEFSTAFMGALGGRGKCLRHEVDEFAPQWQ